MCRKIRCDGESWKLFEFRDELNKAKQNKNLVFFQEVKQLQI